MRTDEPRFDERPLRFETTKKAAVLFTLAGISLLVMAYNIGPITQGLVGSFDWESSSLQANAEASVRGQLIDPDSARFEQPFVIRSERFVCGYVNAKNRFGGYVGRQLYVYSGGSAILVPDHLRPSDAAWKHLKDYLSKCNLSSPNRVLEEGHRDAMDRTYRGVR